MLRAAWYEQKWYNNPDIRIPRYFRSVVGILRHGCYWPRTAQIEWVNQRRTPHKGKWGDRTWRAKHKTWYIGFQKRIKPHFKIVGTGEGIEKCGDYFIPCMEPPRRNYISDKLNEYTDKLYSIGRLRY